MIGVRSATDGTLGRALILVCLLLCAGWMDGARADQPVSRLLLQTSRLAGFRYYDGKQVWDQLKQGDALVLLREPDNAFDTRAVRVLWQGHLLGYVPRAENVDVARLLDHGARLDGHIVSLTRTRRRQIVFEIDETVAH